MSTEAHAAAAGHAATPEKFDAGATIMHHIEDTPVLYEVPFTSIKWDMTEVHWNLFGLDISLTKHVVMMWLALAFLVVLTRIAVAGIKSPAPKGIRNALEVIIIYIRDEVAAKAIGHGSEKFVGFLLSTFFFILTCNLIGLVPSMATATGNVSVTAGLAIIAFVVIQMGGIIKYGPFKHMANLVPHGLPLWLIPLMFLLEIMSMFIKPFALCIRLFANMMAGHVVILAFISLIFIMREVWFAVAPVAVFFALFVHLLEILVAVVQAYIFTMLTAQFIGMSVNPSH